MPTTFHLSTKLFDSKRINRTEYSYYFNKLNLECIAHILNVLCMFAIQTYLNNYIMYKQLIVIMSFLFSLSISAQDIKLNAPNKDGGKPLMQALSERKSSREFQDKELPVTVLSDLLWAANGFNRAANRTAPTANDRQEIELYVTLESGVYWYDAKNLLLKLIKSGDYRKSTGSQDFVADAALNVIFVADMNKASSREYAYTDCGFIAQNIYLFAASENLGSVTRGWYDKDVLAKLLDLPSHQEVLLTQTVGYTK